MAEFDFRELTAKAFSDYVGPYFPSWWQNNKTKLVLPDLHNVSAAMLLGSPYFQRLKVADKQGNIYTFPNEPLVSLSVSKTIVETATVGKYRKGTVKEYITTEDYTISIRGIIFGEDQEVYPAKEVEELNDWFNKNEALEFIENPFLELFKIRKMVFIDIDFAEMAGAQGVQKYTITAKSDMDFYAELTEKQIEGATSPNDYNRLR